MSSTYTGFGGGRVDDKSVLERPSAPFAVVFQSPKKMQSLGETAGDLTVKARDRLQKALAVLNNPESWRRHHVQSYAAQYFLIPQLTEGAANQKIKPILELTWNGLGSSALRISVKKQVDDSGAHGAVTHNEHTRGIANGVLNLEDGYRYQYDTIQIASQMFKNKNLHRNAVQTIIHEATHKFAGTWDYCYFDEDGKKPQKPSIRGLVGIKSDPNGFVDATAALENADSFAWFAYNIGR